ncbi:hypothetical protein BGZ76_009302 [Entomortierella beljakovae]|nr:hypothetical protein BGZ76_009302 [Entomortierella beljakovae]
MAESKVNIPTELKLSGAATAFRNKDFFKSCILLWSAALDIHSPSETDDILSTLASELDLEKELAHDSQPMVFDDLVFSPKTNTTESIPSAIDAESITPIQTYILSTLCYLSWYINIRIDILPSSQDTLTSLGAPQRYYMSLSAQQKDRYHSMLAIVLSTVTSALTASQSTLSIESHEVLSSWTQQMQARQTAVLGNTSLSTVWQSFLKSERIPHKLPRFFSYLNTCSFTVAGSSIPRSETDIDSFEEAGFRLVITLCKESPLLTSWFNNYQGSLAIPKKIKNAFVPIENLMAPEFSEVFEVLVGWCVRTSYLDFDPSQPEYHHKKASLIHCGGGKGRAGIVLAAHLVRFGILGHEKRGYCSDCIREGNVHPYELDQFYNGLGDRDSVASTLPHHCSLIQSDENNNDLTSEDQSHGSAIRLLRPVPKDECLNQYRPMMNANDAIKYLRVLRPGSIESVTQEKAVKAYSDWLWKQSSNPELTKSNKISRDLGCEQTLSVEAGDASPVHKAELSTRMAERKEGKSKKSKSVLAADELTDDSFDDYSEYDYIQDKMSRSKGRMGSGKKSKAHSASIVSEKTTKIPSSQHHQHHNVFQHDIDVGTRQSHRRQKSKKNPKSGGESLKEQPIFQITGAPMTSAPNMVVLAGLPGSGKSHFVATLMQEFPDHFVCISQDDLGSRSACERALGQAMRGPKKSLPVTVFIDRCNPTARERKMWFELAFQPEKSAIFWFTKDAAQCIERVDSRKNHPTVFPGMGRKVVLSFAKAFESPNLSKEGSWCKTLVQVGGDEGSDRLLDIMRKFTKSVSVSSVRPENSSGVRLREVDSLATVGVEYPDLSLPHDKLLSAVPKENEDIFSKDHGFVGTNELNVNSLKAESGILDIALPSTVTTPRVLRFNEHRPIVKKPAKGSWKSSTDASSTSSEPPACSSTSVTNSNCPLQKFPRTPHLFDPLTVSKAFGKEGSRERISESNPTGSGRSSAISRSDLLLPLEDVHRFLSPKPNQVLTVEEKMDGANVGFSVLHPKRVDGFAGVSNTDSLPKIRVQNRSHFVNPKYHWQFKKLGSWVEKYREDILWLCEGRWRFESRNAQKDEVESKESEPSNNKGDVGGEDEFSASNGREMYSSDHEEGDESEKYAEEDKKGLQDELAPYVLYGEWLYAKHAIQYTALTSWFIPFDLYDVKTGTFVSRAVFRKAIAQTSLAQNPTIQIPAKIYGDASKTLEWTLGMLQCPSSLMKTAKDRESQLQCRVEGLYFRIDEGDKLLTRSKVVRHDFIAGNERWGKEQVSNSLLPFEELYRNAE